MKKIKVFPVPQPIEIEGLVILVDILRATSTIVTVLAHDALCVKPVRSIEEALLAKEEGFLLAGERNCICPEGFDMGNSPLEAQKAGGERIILTTTNGTKALSFVKKAKAICAGAFLNLDAVIEFAKRFDEIVVLCAGTDGELSLEDFLFAGKFIQNIGKTELQNDAALVAQKYGESISNIAQEIKNSLHAQRLIKLGFEKDVIFCTQESIYPIVPLLTPEGFVPLKGFTKSS